LDLKGELHSGDARVEFPGTAGWRAKLGPVIRFAPTEAISDRLNLLDTIRPGAQEVRDVQNLVELIADPYGDGRFQEFWDRAAKQVLAGLIIHVVYAEPLLSKTLARVFELLARFDDTVKLMEATLHRKTRQPASPKRIQRSNAPRILTPPITRSSGPASRQRPKATLASSPIRSCARTRRRPPSASQTSCAPKSR
jgi:type IV secretory pathway TraG/TraD family ATPase VirD4